MIALYGKESFVFEETGCAGKYCTAQTRAKWLQTRVKKKKRIELTALKSRTERHLHHSFQRGSLYYPYTPALLPRRRIMQGKDFFIFYLKIWEGIKTKPN